MASAHHACSLTCAAIALLPIALLAQQTSGEGGPAFEAATLKLSGENAAVQVGPGSVTFTSQPFKLSGQRLTCDLPLQSILKEAFHIVEDYRLVAPDWTDIQRYQIAALMTSGTTRETARPMLERLLRERLGLAYHRDRKELTVYALVNAASANLPAVQRVSFLVDGHEVDTIAGHVDVRRPLLRNTSLVRERDATQDSKIKTQKE